MGYEATTRQYRVYDVVKDKLTRSSNVIFFENDHLQFRWPDGDQFGEDMDEPFDSFEAPEPEVDPPLDLPLDLPLNLRGNLRPGPLPGPLAEQAPPNEDSQEPDIRRSSQVRKPTRPFKYAHNAISRPKEPRTCREAIKDPIHGVQWKAAIQDELDKLQGMMAWKIVNGLAGHKVIGSKWVFKVK